MITLETAAASSLRWTLSGSMRRGWPCELLLDDVFDGLAGGHIVYWCGLLVIHWSCVPHRVSHLVPTLSNAPDHPTMPVLAIMLLLPDRKWCCPAEPQPGNRFM